MFISTHIQAWGRAPYVCPAGTGVAATQTTDLSTPELLLVAKPFINDLIIQNILCDASLTEHSRKCKSILSSHKNVQEK